MSASRKRASNAPTPAAFTSGTIPRPISSSKSASRRARSGSIVASATRCARSAARRAKRATRSSSVNIRQFLQRQHQCVCAFFAQTVGLYRTIELFGERQAGQCELHATRFAERDAEILDEVLDEKSRLEVAIQNARRQIGQRPARRGSATDRLQ